MSLIGPAKSGIRGIYMRDRSKILISGGQAGIDGQELMDILRRDYHLELEMASGHYATALTSICDTEEEVTNV